MPLLDRCYFNSTSSGLTAFNVGAAVTGYLTPTLANAVNAVIYPYFAQSSDLTQWEVGLGTYNNVIGWTVSSNDTVNGFSTSNPVTVNKPSGTLDGDIVYIVGIVRSATNDTLTTPSGFSVVGPTNYTNGTNIQTNGYLFYKAASSEPTSYSISNPNGDNISFAAFRVTPIGGTVAIDKSTTWSNSNGGFINTFTFNALSGLAFNNDLIIDLTIDSAPDLNGATYTLPSGDTQLVTHLADSPSLVASYQVLTTNSIAAGSTTITSGGFTVGASTLRAAFKITSTGMSLGRTTVLYSSNSNAKVNFTFPPTVGISATKGLDFSNEIPVTVTASVYTVDSGTTPDTDLILNPTTALTLTLPSAAAWSGRKLGLKNISTQAVSSATSNVVLLAGGSAGTVIFSSVSTPKWVEIQSDASVWQTQKGN